MLMALFHFIYDLGLFNLIHFSYENSFIKNFRLVIVTLFLSLFGYGMYQDYHRNIVITKVINRLMKLGGSALTISVITYIFSPDNWIYFGILHFITLASLVAIPFARIPSVALILGLGILVQHLLIDSSLVKVCDSLDCWSQATYLIRQVNEWGLTTIVSIPLPDTTLDLVRFDPWIGVVLIGIWLGEKKLFGLKINKSKITKNFAFLGQNSLIFYLTHQGILLPIAFICYWFTAI